MSTSSSSSIQQLGQDGYSVFSVRDRVALDELTSDIADALLPGRCARSSIRSDAFSRLEELHESPPFNLPDINDSRVAAIKAIGHEHLAVNRRAIALFDAYFVELLGPDLLLQRGVNLVIQRPHDPDPSEPHRDFPANGAFELVLWLPFVNCPIERSMYIVPYERSLEIARDLAGSKFADLDSFREMVERCSVRVAVSYGEALVFMTCCFHGSRINVSSGTRVSLNARVKSAFSPRGMKDPNSFWDVYRISPLARLALRASINEG